MLLFGSFLILRVAFPAKMESSSSRSTGMDPLPSNENSEALAPPIVTLNVRYTSLLPTPLLKYSGPSVPPYRKPDASPQKLALKSNSTLIAASISIFDNADVFEEGKAGANEMPPLFRTDTGTVTITRSASAEKGSPDPVFCPLTITLSPA